MPLNLRLATAADLPAINEIYNYYVPRSTCTYQLEPETLEARQAWFEGHPPDKYPVTVRSSTARLSAGARSPNFASGRRMHRRWKHRFTFIMIFIAAALAGLCSRTLSNGPVCSVFTH